MKRTLTKGERLVAEMCGDIPTEGHLVLTEAHPFLRKVIEFTEKRNEWIGTVSDLLMAVGDKYTPPNTAAKLLRKYEYDLLYTPVKYSTCITQGHDGYWQCSDTTCNQLFDADGNPISAIPYRELAAHTEGTQWLNDENYHWHVCTTEGCGAVIYSSKAEHADTDNDHKCDVCKEVISTCADTDNNHMCDICSAKLSDHTGGTATCNAKAICKVCLEPYGEKNSNNHVNLKQFPENAATADEEGNIEYWYCDGCKKYFSDENGTNEIEQENIVIEKLEPDDSDDSSGGVRMFYWLKWLLEFLNKLMTKMFNVLGWAC